MFPRVQFELRLRTPNERVQAEIHQLREDPLFLQIKEAEASVLEEPLGPSEFKNHGERVVTGQRLTQASSDILLGWVRVESPLDGKSRDVYGRQLKDWKGSAEIDQLLPEGMTICGRLCGWTLGRAHARSGERTAIAAYMGNGDNFDRAILEFSRAYADQNERVTELWWRRSNRVGSSLKPASEQ